MINDANFAFGLALLSMALLVGWFALKQKKTGDPTWQKFFEQWPGHIAQIFYFVGIPYLAIILGQITPGLLGLKGVEHIALINWNNEFVAGQLQQAAALVLLEWLFDLPAAVVVGSIAIIILAAVWGVMLRYPLHLETPGFSVLSAIYYGLHWAFYRAIFWLITGDLYLGTVLGATWVIIEWTLCHLVQKQQSASQQKFLINLIILTLTATVFYYSPNLWLLFPIHLVLMAVVNQKPGVSQGKNLLSSRL